MRACWDEDWTINGARRRWKTTVHSETALHWHTAHSSQSDVMYGVVWFRCQTLEVGDSSSTLLVQTLSFGSQCWWLFISLPLVLLGSLLSGALRHCFCQKHCANKIELDYSFSYAWWANSVSFHPSISRPYPAYDMLWLQKGREACRKAPIRFCSRCPVGGDMIPLPKGQALGIISIVTATIETKSLSWNVTLHLNLKFEF